MNGLSLSMLCSLAEPICSVFNDFIRRIVKYNSLKELPLLYFILSQTVVPDNSFKWLVSSMRSSIDIISCLIKHRLWLDNRVDSILRLVEDSEEDEISCSELDEVLLQNNIYLSVYEKHYIFRLLSKQERQDSSLYWKEGDFYECNKPYPIRNISVNYRPTKDLVMDAICQAADLADHALLRQILTAASTFDIPCAFDPQTHVEHAEVLAWIHENILKGCKGEKNLGWIEGPDSAKWPSTELKDYVKTLDCLYAIMP